MIPLVTVIGILLLGYLLFFLENRRFIVRRDRILHKKIKTPFTVVQVSDLHDRRFGKDQAGLLSAIREAEPDLIVITGDLFNRKNENACRNAFCFVKGAVEIAPVYFAEGNHECSLGKTGENRIEEIRKAGVRVLRNESVDLDSVRLIGLRQYAEPEQLAGLLDSDRFNLVLSHRAELFPKYSETGADVILSGHAHGGQIRLFGLPVYSPEQGVFPKYTSGFYRLNGSLMFVSRGLGNTIPFPRIFNTPELNVLQFDKREEGE